MKVILYIAATINGFIARRDDSTLWSDDEWDAYASMVKRVGNIIIGRKTYELMRGEELQKIGNPFVIVITRQKENKRSTENVIFAETPEEALKIIKSKGYKETMVNGGTEIISLFAQKKLFDEIYIDIEPFLFGTGRPLMLNSDLEYQLQLFNAKKLNTNTVQLHYKIC